MDVPRSPGGIQMFGQLSFAHFSCQGFFLHLTTRDVHVTTSRGSVQHAECQTSGGSIKCSQVNVEPSAAPLRLVAAVLAASPRSTYREKATRGGFEAVSLSGIRSVFCGRRRSDRVNYQQQHAGNTPASI